MAKNIEIYTWSTCPFCVRAKSLLDAKDLDYIEHNLDGDEPARTKMAERTGGKKSVPQIFIGEYHVGGCDDLFAAETSGKLDELLSA